MKYERDLLRCYNKRLKTGSRKKNKVNSSNNNYSNQVQTSIQLVRPGTISIESDESKNVNPIVPQNENDNLKNSIHNQQSNNQEKTPKVVSLFESKKSKNFDDDNENGISIYNFTFFIINIIFTIIHIIISSIYIDGIQSIIPFWTVELLSVIMVINIMIINSYDRGLIFGFRFGRLLNEASVHLLSEHMAYIESFTYVLLLWYHPTENSIAHLSGFIGIGFLLTRIHLRNSYIIERKEWNLFIELWMMAHIILSFIQKETGYKWIGFLFGFLLTISINQLFIFEKLRKVFIGKRFIWIRFVPFTIIIVISFILSYFKRSIYIILLTLAIPMYIIINIGIILILLNIINLIDKRWIRNEKFYINTSENNKDIILRIIFFIITVITVTSTSFIMVIKNIPLYIKFSISNIITLLLVTINVYVCSKFREIPGLPDVNSIWGRQR